MPELRQNYATKEWVIIASERAKRPSSYTEPDHRLLTSDRKPYDPNCPFCPGNEELDLEIERFPSEGPWQVRVVRNKYPALAGEGLPMHTSDGVQSRIAAVGHHEVVVVHPQHNMTLALMEAHEIHLMLTAMQRRGQVMSQDPRIQNVVYFKNHGERAGASLAHPHCQIIGMPVVPDTIRRRINETQLHYQDTGKCPFCVMLEDELHRKERLITVGEHFVAFSLFAAFSPFHLWVLPRQHRASFLDVPADELADLAHVLRDVLRRVYVGLRDPAYNIIVRSAPLHNTDERNFHWYISIVLRLSRMAGFELGSGMHINPSLPESCAQFLREVDL